MIRGFERNQPLDPAAPERMQWGPAVGAGVITGFVLLLVPRGSPWASLTFFSPVVVGRETSLLGLAPEGAWLLHLLVSLVYGLIISLAVARLRKQRAIFTGGLLGLALYLINFGVVSTFWPAIRGNEFSVIFTHLVFGLVAAGAYRGLLKRHVPA